MHQSSAAVGPQLNVMLFTKLIQFYSTVTLILSQNSKNFILISEKHPYFSNHQKNVNITSLLLQAG